MNLSQWQQFGKRYSLSLHCFSDIRSHIIHQYFQIIKRFSLLIFILQSSHQALCPAIHHCIYFSDTFQFQIFNFQSSILASYHSLSTLSSVLFFSNQRPFHLISFLFASFLSQFFTMPTGVSSQFAEAHLSYKKQVRIYTINKDCGISIKEIAKRVNISYSTV